MNRKRRGIKVKRGRENVEVEKEEAKMKKQNVHRGRKREINKEKKREDEEGTGYIHKMFMGVVLQYTIQKKTHRSRANKKIIY